MILINGTPFCLVVPGLFVSFFQYPDDYSERAYVSSFLRLLRYLALIITISLPSIYIALASFHHELIPYRLLIPMAEDRAQVPFPPLVEVLMMEIVIEFLREAGMHLPPQVGQTFGVVGGIILGQAAVSANLVSPILLVIVAVTAICSFVIPDVTMATAVRLLRFPLLIITGVLGAFGLTLGWLLLLVHLIKQESFSVPYLAPFAPARFADWKDTFYRTFSWRMRKRPLSIPGPNRRRQENMRWRDGKDER